MSGAMQQRREMGLQRFKPYPAYKDSGVEWLEEIPSGWRLLPVKRVIGFTTGWTPPTGEQRFYEGDHFWANISDLGPRVLYETQKTISDEAAQKSGIRASPPGSLLFAFKLSVGAASIAGASMYTNEAIATFLPGSGLDVGFLYWAAPVYVPQNAVENIYGAQLLNRERIANAWLCAPPAKEQRAIAAFLDRETAKIDALVAKKERLIELLQEKRTALITRAVTKGRDPNVPMKDSGVEWLGDIPAHWGVGSLSRWWQVIDCKHRTVPFLDEGMAIASIGEVQGLEVDLSTAKRTSDHEYRQMVSGDRDPRLGDIIYSRNATVGAAALVTTEERFCMGQDVSLIRAADQDQRFLVFLLRSPAVMSQLDVWMVGSTFSRINVSKIKKLAICVPPAEEQREIGGFCDQEHRVLDALMDRIRDGIERLKEFRAALISLAVTGKIDVREA